MCLSPTTSVSLVIDLCCFNCNTIVTFENQPLLACSPTKWGTHYGQTVCQDCWWKGVAIERLGEGMGSIEWAEVGMSNSASYLHAFCVFWKLDVKDIVHMQLKNLTCLTFQTIRGLEDMVCCCPSIVSTNIWVSDPKILIPPILSNSTMYAGAEDKQDKY